MKQRGITLLGQLLKTVEFNPKRELFKYKLPKEIGLRSRQNWQIIQASEFYDEIRWVAFGLQRCGIEVGDRVALLSRNRYECAVAEMSIIANRSVSVPISVENSDDHLAFILNHSAARILFVEDYPTLERILKIRRNNPILLAAIEHIIVIDNRSSEFGEADIADVPFGIMSYYELTQTGDQQIESNIKSFSDLIEASTPEDLVSLCYSSGTVALPKATKIYQGRLIESIDRFSKGLRDSFVPFEEKTLCHVPLNHLFYRLEMFGSFLIGWTVQFSSSDERLLEEELKSLRPSMIFTWPKIVNSIYRRISDRTQSDVISKELTDHAMQLGRGFLNSSSEGKKPSLKESSTFLVSKRVLRRFVRSAMGTEIKMILSAGSRLPDTVLDFFHLAGVPLLEGYGLSETLGVVSINLPGNIRLGSVGKPLPGHAIRTSESGELLADAAGLFGGYFRDPSTPVDHPTFKTGDFGSFDQDGYLFVSDRCDEIIETKDGTRVLPSSIEIQATDRELIDRMFVTGGDFQNSELAALISLDRKALIAWAKENDILFSEYGQLLRNPRTIAMVQREVDQINRDVPAHQKIKRFSIAPNQFDISTGEVASNQELRKNAIREKFKEQIDLMKGSLSPQS